MTKSDFAIFDSENLGNVRSVYDPVKGKCWYVAEDICKCLGIKNVSRACAYMFHDEVDTRSVCETRSDGIIQLKPRLVISEEAVMLLIMRSNKNEARRFQQWVMHKLLPAYLNDIKAEV